MSAGGAVPRTRKQTEADRRTIEPYVAEGDLLGAYLVSQIIARGYEAAGDVFGNPCRCRMDDDGEWVDSFCPEHGS